MLRRIVSAGDSLITYSCLHMALRCYSRGWGARTRVGLSRLRGRAARRKRPMTLVVTGRFPFSTFSRLEFRAGHDPELRMI